jgi:two-component system OmpR family sensor kinase
VKLVLRPRLVPRTLRGRLLAGILFLVTAGLLGADLAAYTMLRSFFAARVERQLTKTADRVDQTLSRRVDVQVVERALRALDPARTDVLLLGEEGPVAGPPPWADPQQHAFADALDAAALARLRGAAGRPVRLDLAGQPYRAVYRHPGTAPAANGGTATPVTGFVVAVALREDQDALRQLAGDEAIITLVALLTLGGLALAVLRVGLRPLRSMAAAATAIAAGDGARRIRADHPQTETGRLAEALNRAFAQRRQAEERLRRFVADASHELRTPLSTIGGWADLYFQGGLPDPAAVETAMSRIASETAHLRSLVEELLLLARLDHSRPLDPQPVDLAALVDEIVADARVIDPGRLVTGPGPAPAPVVGDPQRLRQVVRNLVGNALQHTPAGTPVHVTIEAGTGADAAPCVHLTIADEGPGIPADARVHLFEAFSGADPLRRSGRGLPIVRTILEAHHGTIDLHDGGTTGATFRVTLPAAPARPQPGRPDGTAPLDRAPGPAVGSGAGGR